MPRTRESIIQERGGLKTKRDRKYWFAGLCVISVFALISGVAISGERLTITGTVNAVYQIEADTGQIYEVEETEKGHEVAELVGKKVKVTGTVEEIEDMKVITIISYEVIGE